MSFFRSLASETLSIGYMERISLFVPGSLSCSGKDSPVTLDDVSESKYSVPLRWMMHGKSWRGQMIVAKR